MAMEDPTLLRTFLADQTLASVVPGLWYFAEGPVTDQRVPPASLYRLYPGWSQLAADLILAEPTGGVFGFAATDRDWVRQIGAVLAARGAELPVTELDRRSRRVWGVPLGDYPPGARLTTFLDIHTLGEQARRLRRVVESYGLRVGRIVALVDRGPIPTVDVDGVPLASVLHLPLSLYRSVHDLPEQLRHSSAGGASAARRHIRAPGSLLIS
jgi:hypothetical protein